LLVLRVHAFALSGDAPPLYDGAIIAAVECLHSDARREITNKTNTEGEKP
jgi:hypothetical protein